MVYGYLWFVEKICCRLFWMKRSLNVGQVFQQKIVKRVLLDVTVCFVDAGCKVETVTLVTDTVTETITSQVSYWETSSTSTLSNASDARGKLIETYRKRSSLRGRGQGYPEGGLGC